jgi:glycosyltransferase involved in cell wall biosynthesis
VPAQPVNPAVEAITAFFPCYNDEATIGRVVETVAATLESLGVDGEIIVVNDGSSDGSAGVLDRLSRIEPRLRVVTHESNRGYGGALQSGFAAATKQWIFYTDGDGQYDAAELAVLVSHACDAVDVVQAYKLNRADHLVRRVIGRMYNGLVVRLFDLKIRDTDCDFRLIRAAKLRHVSLENTSGAICVELVTKLQKSGARFVEVGVHHYPRTSGKSAFFSPPNVLRTLGDVVKLWAQSRIRSRHGA